MLYILLTAVKGEVVILCVKMIGTWADFSMRSKDMAKEIIAFGLKLDADTCGLRLLQLLQSR
jgi:hypothetical protein